MLALAPTLRRLFLALTLMTVLLPGSARAQREAYAISGRTIDSTGTPVPGVRVLLTGLGRTVSTGRDGSFRFTSVPAGSYVLSFSKLGFAPATRRVIADNAAQPVDIRLAAAGIQLSAVQVTATLGATAAQESPQPTAVVEGPELRVAQSAALGETLELVPGVRSLSMTTGIGKPVIRGMTHYRVVTLDNGQRTETQAWGHDHSPNVETASAERIEVIKGPASVLYGSDALGGVINVVAPALPDALDVPRFVRGRVASAYSHNVRGGDGTLMLEGANRGFGARGSVTLRGSGDMRTPAGVLANTNNTARALDGAAGFRGGWGSISLRYTGRNERIEIFDDPATNPGYSGFQRIGTHRALLEVQAPVRGGRLQVSTGFEENLRQEFAGLAATEPDLGLFVRNWTGTAYLHHDRVAGLSGTLGISGMTSDFENRGTETLIPSSASGNAAVFAFEQADFGRWRATIGGRYDYRTLETSGNTAIQVPAQRHVFNAVTGSAGLLYRATEAVALLANVARGFRAPAAPDLFANGFHEGTRAFERGNPDLDVETSLNSEVGVRVNRENVTAEATAFVNQVKDYIYLRPFGTGARAYDSLQVVQGDARLAGAEARVAYQPVRFLTLQASGDFVHGQNMTAGVPLTFIPPLRIVYGARVEDPVSHHGTRTRYLSFSAETNARQTRLDPSDTGPAGYTIASLGAGVTRPTRSGAFTLDVSVRNLFDTSYRSFMSRYKEYAFGPGRSLMVRMSTAF